MNSYSIDDVFNVDFLKTLLIPKEVKASARSCYSIARLYDIKLKCSYNQDERSFFFYKDIDRPGKILLDFKKSYMSGFDLCCTFTHELAHGVQWIVLSSLPVDIVDNLFFNDFQTLIKYERAAERLAYFICKLYFPELMNELGITHREYRAYTSKKDIDFLYNHYKKNHDDFKKWKELSIINEKEKINEC